MLSFIFLTIHLRMCFTTALVFTFLFHYLHFLKLICILVLYPSFFIFHLHIHSSYKINSSVDIFFLCSIIRSNFICTIFKVTVVKSEFKASMSLFLIRRVIFFSAETPLHIFFFLCEWIILIYKLQRKDKQ